MARTDSEWETTNGGSAIKTIAPAGYDVLINGLNKYLNFNTVIGSTGYGFRDNNGTIQFKNSGGVWSSIGDLTKSQADLLYYPLPTNPAGYLTVETDPVWTSEKGSYALKTDYLAINQTTPQTTVGRFTFPDLTVGTDTIYTKDGTVLIGGTNYTTYPFNDIGTDLLQVMGPSVISNTKFYTSGAQSGFIFQPVPAYSTSRIGFIFGRSSNATADSDDFFLYDVADNSFPMLYDSNNNFGLGGTNGGSDAKNNALWISGTTGHVMIGTPTDDGSLLQLYTANDNVGKTTMLTQTVADSSGNLVGYYKFLLGAHSERGGDIVFGEVNGFPDESGLNLRLNNFDIYQGGAYSLTLSTGSKGSVGVKLNANHDVGIGGYIQNGYDGNNDLTNSTLVAFASGNVAIGQTSDDGYKLKVAGSVYINPNQTDSSLKVGTLEFQNYGLNNSWFGDNIYYGPSGFTYRADGAGGIFYFQGNEGQFRFFPSGSAGTAAGGAGQYVQMKTTSDGQWGLGGAAGSAIGTGTGDFSGAQVYKTAGGHFILGSTTDYGDVFQANGTAMVSSNMLIGATTRANIYGVPFGLEIQFNDNGDAYSYPMGFINKSSTGGNFIFTSFSQDIAAALAGDVMIENNRGGFIFSPGAPGVGGDIRFKTNGWTNTSVLALKVNGNVLAGTDTDDGANRFQVSGNARISNVDGTATVVTLGDSTHGYGSSAYLNLTSGNSYTETQMGFWNPSAPSGEQYKRFGFDYSGGFNLGQFLNDSQTEVLSSPLNIAPTTNNILIHSYWGTSTGRSGENFTDDGINSLQVGGGARITGSLTLAYKEISSLRTLDATDYTVNCTANTFTVTLPTAVGITGRIYIVKNSGTGVITVATTSSQTIDGATTQTLLQYNVIRLQSDGANWVII